MYELFEEIENKVTLFTSPQPTEIWQDTDDEQTNKGIDRHCVFPEAGDGEKMQV